MSDNARHQLFIELSKNLRTIGIAVLVFVGVLVPLRYQYQLDFLDFYIILIGISALIVLGVSSFLIIYRIKKYPKNKD